MRILHVVWTLELVAGGPPVVVTRLAGAQARLGHQVTILTHAPRVGQAEVALPRDDHATPIAIEHVPGSGRERVFCRLARLRLRELAPRVDIVHVHGVWAPIGWAASAIARRSGIPCCIAPHGMLDPWALNSQGCAKRLKKHLALTLSLRRLLNDAAFIHVLNHDEGSLLAPLRLRGPFEIVPNGVTPEEFHPPPPSHAFIDLHPALRGRTYILSLCRLHAKKGLEVLLAAFAKLSKARSDVDLVLAGPDGGVEAELRRQALSLGLQSRIHFVGALDGPAKLAALAGCACFCLPSRQEGFSMAVLEAMMVGRPVVITPACHFPEVEAANAGFVAPCEPDAICDSLWRLLSDQPLAHLQGENALRLVREHFSWSAAASRSIAAYQRAAAGGR